MPNLTADAIRELIRRYYSEGLAVVSEIALLGPQDRAFDRDAELEGARSDEIALRHRIGSREYDPIVRQAARDLLIRHGFSPVAQAGEEFDVLCNGVLRAKAEQRRVLIALLQGDMGATRPQDPIFEGNSPRSLAPATWRSHERL